jgi:hypothetical protein
MYSIDGIGVYENADITRIGTASFTDASDGFMIMTYYELEQSQNIDGVQILLDSYAFDSEDALSTAGGEIVISLRYKDDVVSEDENFSFEPNAMVNGTESDFYMITDNDITNGYVNMMYDTPIWLQSGGYYV